MTKIAKTADEIGNPELLVRGGNLRVETRPIFSLKPFPRNARTHSKKQIHQIAASIREFGFTNPVLIDEFGVIVAGHGRVEAAKLLKLTRVPTIRIDYLSEGQKRAYVIADNKLALNAGWDPRSWRSSFRTCRRWALNLTSRLPASRPPRSTS
jgi:hypothetical protein